MAIEIVAQGQTIAELQSGNYDEFIAEGQRAILVVQCPVDISGALQRALTLAGVNLWENVSYADGNLRIPFQKGFAWIPVIVGILIIMSVAVIAWAIYKVVDIIGGFIPPELRDFLKKNAVYIAIGVVALIAIPLLLPRH